MPIIDLGQLLGYSNVRLKSSNDTEKDTANSPPKNSSPARPPTTEQEDNRENGTCTIPAGLHIFHLQNDGEPRHPRAAAAQNLAPMTGLSFSESSMLGPSLPCEDIGINSTVDALSITVPKPALKLVATDSKIPAKPLELVLNGSNEVQQQSRRATPELQVSGTKAGKAKNTTAGQAFERKAGKVEPIVDSTTVMPNRSICVPLLPLPSMCSR